MAESSLSRRQHSRTSLRTRVAQNVQGFLFFMSLWSAESTAAIIRRRNRRTYQIKRGHVRYGNKWITLQKFRAIQVLPLLLFSLSKFACHVWLFLLLGSSFLSVNGLVLLAEELVLFNASTCLCVVLGLVDLIIIFIFFHFFLCTNVTYVI